MNAVGIDVSNGKSMVCIMRPFGEVVASPYEISHTTSELNELVNSLKSLGGETKIIMECTGVYHQAIARPLCDAGLFVSTVHPKLIHGFGNNTIRKVKTDKADAIKISNYGLANWLTLQQYTPEDEIRQILKGYNRQYQKYSKLKTMLKNNLVARTEQTFPGIRKHFTSPPRKNDGHEKWVDFVATFWHIDCVGKHSFHAFSDRYQKWCKRLGYQFSTSKAEQIHAAARSQNATVPNRKSAELLVMQAVRQLNAISESLTIIGNEMIRIAEALPEHPVVTGFYGVGRILGAQIMAEVGDVRKFAHKGSLVCFAGLEAPPFQSGNFESRNRHISKKGSPFLRKSLFLVMDCLIKNAPSNDPIYQFLDRKRADGKHYYSYMTAGSAKFLRIYYARVKEHLAAQNV